MHVLANSEESLSCATLLNAIPSRAKTSQSAEISSQTAEAGPKINQREWQAVMEEGQAVGLNT